MNTLVGEKIRAARNKKGWDQRTLAKKSKNGISQGMISLIETGKGSSGFLENKIPFIYAALGISERAPTTLTIPAGATRIERAPCTHCNGTGFGWKFYNGK